jgi:hypothetical protein
VQGRGLCLTCHQEQKSHYTSGQCAVCHAVPEHAREGQGDQSFTRTSKGSGAGRP